MSARQSIIGTFFTEFKKPIFPIGLMIALWLLTAGLWSIIQDAFKKMSSEQIAFAGQVGDSFGGVNAVFSGLAFLGLVVALWYQHQDIELQKETSRRAEDEQREVIKVQEASIKTLERQSESLFRAAYLNAMVAVRDTPAPETLPPEQWNAAERLRSMLGQMDTQAEALFGEMPAPPDRAVHFARRIERCKKVFDAYVPRLNTEQPIRDASFRTIQKYVRDVLRKELEDIISELPATCDDQVKSLFQWLAEIETYELSGVIELNPVRAEYKAFWDLCETVHNILHNLAEKCRQTTIVVDDTAA